MDASVIVEVTRKLIGEIEPTGDPVIDEERARNLDKLIDVINWLLEDLTNVGARNYRKEALMPEMGEEACTAIAMISDFLNKLQKMWADG